MLKPLLSGLLLLLALPLSAAASGGDSPIGLFVSVEPLRYLAERVGGDRLVVHSLVLPGHSPATYAPSPRQMAELATARLFWRVGVPFEAAWMSTIEAANPALVVIDARQGIALHPGTDPEHPGSDPHIWTDPLRARAMARRLSERLVALDPEHGAAYRANFAALARDLEQLDQRIRERLSGLKERRFLVFHPAWGYFADRYGLEQLAIEVEGKSPGARGLIKVIQRARELGAKVVFVQPQFSQRDAQAVAHAIGARLVVLDPLAYALPDALWHAAQAMAEAP